MNSILTNVVAIDAMGGDHAPQVPVYGAIKALEQDSKLKIVLCGCQDHIAPLLSRIDSEVIKRITIHHCNQVVGNNDKPSMTIRRGQASSMNQAICLLSADKAFASVSAGNTGALMALSLFNLRCLTGVSRPVLSRAIPTQLGKICLLDLGANLQATADDLVEYAAMGVAFAEVTLNKTFPRIALLNVGTEQIKGLPEIREADNRLQQSHLNYIGYIEGNDLLAHRADVIVCDGFSGNLVLKTAEGVFCILQEIIRQSFADRFRSILGGLLVRSSLKDSFQRFDPTTNEGAALLGLRKTVVKTHGNVNVVGFANAISMANDMSCQGMQSAIERHIAQMQTTNKF